MNSFKIKFFLSFFLLLQIVFGNMVFGQTPTVLYTSLTSTTPSPSNSRYTLNAMSGTFRQYRFQANQTVGSSGSTWAFHQGTTASPSYTNSWRPYTSNNLLSVNTYIPIGFANGARYNNNGGTDGQLPAITSGNYYTFNVSNNTGDNVMQLLETTYNPVTVSTVTQAVGSYGSRTITITTSTTPNASENIYVRYSTNSYTASTIVQATGSGTTWTATIPWQSSAVSFYVYTSNKTLSQINGDVTSYGQTAHDMSTLNLNNSGGSNYNWTPPTGAIIVTSSGGSAANTPTAYPAFNTASTGLFAVLNTGTVHQGTVTALVTADITETGSVALANSSNWTSLLVNPNGARTISGAAAAGAPLIDFNGADNVTFNGLNSGGNSLTISNTTVSPNSGTSTIQFRNDATSNTITNCTVLGSATMAVGTNGGNIFFGAGSATTGNDNNTISNCNIGPAGSNIPSKLMHFGGTSNTDPGTANSGNTINNNNFYDWFSAGSASAAIDINSGSTNFTISNNRFYQTATRTHTSGVTHSGIYMNNSSGYLTISGNTFGFSSSTGTGTYTFVGVSGSRFIPININGCGTATATSIQGNTIAGIAVSGAMSGTSSSSPFMGVYVSTGLTTIGNVTGNTIGSLSTTGSITYTTSSTSATDVHGMYNFGSSIWTANNNNLGSISCTNSSTGSIVFYGFRTGTSANFSASSNSIGGTISNSIQVSSSSTSSQVIGYGMNSTYPSPSTFTSNIIRNLTNNNGTGTTSSASVIGINLISTSVNHTIGQNQIFNLSNTNATAATIVTGIQITGSTANIVERNFIYGLTSSTTSASAEVNGIRVAGGTTTYRNNMIVLGAGISNAIGAVASNTGQTGINGFNGALGTDNFWHNSIYIGGTATAGTGASYAFNGTQTVNTRSFRNNIFVNARTNSGATGKHYAIKINGAPNPSGLTLNNNIYFTSGTGGVFGYASAADVANLAAWQTAVGQDANSYSSNPQFIAPTAATPDLHLSASNATLAEGNGSATAVTMI
ncbi:MAG: hypothetical protein EBQ94_01235 [Flavobacteriales bacterium]|nr:hypothetical protein [Flavobacteriales bacterium]